MIKYTVLQRMSYTVTSKHCTILLVLLLKTGCYFQRLSFRTPLNRALLMTSFTSSIDITPVNTLTLVQKWTYEIGPSNSLFILSVKPSHLTFHKLTCYCVLAFSYQLTNREASTVLCSVIKHAGSG